MPRTKRKDKSRAVLRTGESQRADGTYQFRWTDSNHKRFCVYAKTLDELRYKEEQIKKDKSDGIKTEARYTTVNEVYELWKELKRGLKNNTFENYKYMYETFVRHQIGSKTVSSLKKTDIKRFYNYLTDERQLKPSTIDSSLIAVSGKNKETMLLIKYAEEILDWLSSTYKEKEAFIREALEMKVNNIFEQMYHGHRRVSIDQKYQVTLLTTIEDKEVAAGESEGSNRVKSFAFIAGLVALAKEKLIANAGEEGFNLSSEPYPLVMDAPFSNADETHTANISKVLPEIAEQVIMFVMQKDWRYAEPVMATRVGKQYELKKLSETHTVLQ